LGRPRDSTSDFLFVCWYLIRLAGHGPFSRCGFDIKSHTMAVLGTDCRESTKPNIPKAWFDKMPHTHVALDEAVEQGALFCNMLEYNRARGATHAH
jgi:hypothetical protein